MDDATTIDGNPETEGVDNNTGETREEKQASQVTPLTPDTHKPSKTAHRTHRSNPFNENGHAYILTGEDDTLTQIGDTYGLNKAKISKLNPAATGDLKAGTQIRIR